MELEGRMVSLDRNAAALCNRVEYLIAQQVRHPQKRILIALAGVPGSGKSTLCRAVVDALSTRGIVDVAVVPMDGFHYPQAILSTFKDPVLAFQKRGAPFTFDAAAFVEFVMKLSAMPVTADGDREHILQAPSFDHAKQDPIADDIKISSRSKVAIIEGNYTLLNEIPWNSVSKIVDDSWFIDVPRETAKQRLVERHIEAGIETSRISATRRVEDNDIPNGEFIKARLIQPNITLLN